MQTLPTCSLCRRSRSTTSPTLIAPFLALRNSSRTSVRASTALCGPFWSRTDEVVGVWTHSVAVGRHANAPVPELFAPGAATEAEIGAALDRYRAFITG